MTRKDYKLIGSKVAEAFFNMDMGVNGAEPLEEDQMEMILDYLGVAFMKDNDKFSLDKFKDYVYKETRELVASVS